MRADFSPLWHLQTSIAVNRQFRRPKLIAISSGGGHWVQLLRVADAFRDCEVIFVTTHESYRPEVAEHRFYTVCDSCRSSKFALIRTAQQLALILATERPDIVISTGAAPGYIALRLAHLFGAETVWLDSIANVDHLSLSGLKVGRYADLWLTQWPHLARPEGPYYGGAVL